MSGHTLKALAQAMQARAQEMHDRYPGWTITGGLSFRDDTPLLRARISRTTIRDLRHMLITGTNQQQLAANIESAVNQISYDLSSHTAESYVSR